MVALFALFRPRPLMLPLLSTPSALSGNNRCGSRSDEVGSRSDGVGSRSDEVGSRSDEVGRAGRQSGGAAGHWKEE